MLFTRQILVAALTALPLATACIRATGSGSSGLSSRVNIKINEDGTDTCDGGIDNHNNGNIPCQDGHSLSYDWPHIQDAISVTYTSPAGTQQFSLENLGCTSMNCCGGSIPCNCNSCNFEANINC